MKNETQRLLIVAIIMAVVMGIVGSMVAEDEQKAQEQYCQMVADGLWPDYRAGEVDCDAH
jgi:hypothetical protein